MRSWTLMVEGSRHHSRRLTDKWERKQTQRKRKKEKATTILWSKKNDGAEDAMVNKATLWKESLSLLNLKKERSTNESS